ncbi:Glucose-6-phosphate 1-dehydrogenase [Spiromyces aspiralis]|uniref:Glucose-6-phosphate 1-dehydrogenase n=1 Tax=Spiromyces aspiralis TaxID=68401 RepID=A0ACC1HFC9_9FUNG|nr:Glucose-6-phosphate 1-dehydrogenase [Spiromyces aspiralis]
MSFMCSLDTAARKDEITTIVVFGASGDLAKKKTFPALFHLYKSALLPPHTRIFGYARSDLSRSEYEARITANIGKSDKERACIPGFLNICSYIRGQYDRDDDFLTLRREIEAKEDVMLNDAACDSSVAATSNSSSSGLSIDSSCRAGRNKRVFYLALPPSQFVSVARQIKNNVYDPKHYNRLVIEKPFGHDLESSSHLCQEIGTLFPESEVYRIDHYLGKEMVKNILVLRFANVFFQAVWNKEHISNVQIVFKEPFGTEGRGGYFEGVGIIRDVIQNHLLQVMSIVAMETPNSLDSEDIRDRKTEVLRHIKPVELDQVLLGQYTASKDGSKPGYKDDDGVPKDSNTPTFAQMVLHIDNERWRGVPWVIKAGKALDAAKVLVRIQFKEKSGNVFPDLARNELVVQVSPKEAVYMKTLVKEPGLSTNLTLSELDMTYQSRFEGISIPDAYSTLILDVLNGDHSNFVRADELEEAWRIFTPLLHRIERENVQPQPYAYGSRGPEGADEFAQLRAGYKMPEIDYHWKPVSPTTSPRLVDPLKRSKF